MFDWASLGQYKASASFLDGYPANTRIFWSPEDKIHELIRDFLSAAQRSIVLNMYGFDDADANAILLQKMNDPNIFVQMSLDSTQAAGKAEKELLAQWPTSAMGTTIAIGQSAKHAISHLKVCIVDGIYVMTGSTNWSMGGEQKQDNQLTLTNDPVLAVEARRILDINHSEMQRQMKAKGL